MRSFTISIHTFPCPLIGLAIAPSFRSHTLSPFHDFRCRSDLFNSPNDGLWLSQSSFDLEPCLTRLCQLFSLPLSDPAALSTWTSQFHQVERLGAGAFGLMCHHKIGLWQQRPHPHSCPPSKVPSGPCPSAQCRVCWAIGFCPFCSFLCCDTIRAGVPVP